MESPIPGRLYWEDVILTVSRPDLIISSSHGVGWSELSSFTVRALCGSLAVLALSGGGAGQRYARSVTKH